MSDAQVLAAVAAEAQLVAAQQGVVAAWAGAVANFAVVITSLYLAMSAQREGRRVREEAERRDAETAVHRLELIYVNIKDIVSQLEAAPKGTVVDAGILRAAFAGPRATAEALVSSRIGHVDVHGMSITAHRNITGVAAILDATKGEDVKLDDFMPRTASLRLNLAEGHKTLRAWIGRTSWVRASDIRTHVEPPDNSGVS